MPPDSFKVRPASPNNAEAIAELARNTFGDTSASVSNLQQSIGGWQLLKAPHLVAIDDGDRVIGYARSKPNEVHQWSRREGQVAILAHVAVAPEWRGRGVGSALHDRSLRTLKMLGYSKVFAQVEDKIAPWYAAREWRVHPRGDSVAWIEPPIEQDQEWQPGLLPGTFAPLLLMYFLPKYPNLIERSIGGAQPLVEVSFDARCDDKEAVARVHRKLLALFEREPALRDRLPSGLVRMMFGNTN